MAIGLAFIFILILVLTLLYAWLGWIGVVAGGMLLLYVLVEGLGMDYIQRRFSRKQPRPLVCPQCGYDVRATPERCPECGAVHAVK